MKDSQKTKAQLIAELVEARKKLKALTKTKPKNKKVKQDLNDSEDKFYKAFLASPNMIIISSMKDSKYVEVNESFARITGYSREELIGHTVDEFNLFISPEEQDRMMQILQKKGSLKNERFSFRIRSGEIRQWLCSAEIVNIGDDTCMIAVATDITEQIKAEEALWKSEEKYTKVFRTIPEVISISTIKDGIFKEINDSFCRVMGYSREEVIGHSSKELRLWANPSDRDNLIGLLKKHGLVSNKEYLFRTKTGKIRTMFFSTEEIVLDDEPCLLAVTNDITDYKRMEAEALEAANLREVDRLRTELLANVSHELRTPLAGIKGFATMLLDYEKRLTPQEKREYLETIDKNTDRMVELIEQLLEKSRLDTGMLSIKKSPTNVFTLCQTVINEARVRLATHKFVLDLPKQLPQINLDERRIRQVLDNVIDNAVKYSEAGTEITLAVRATDQEMVFSITDRGIGIPEKDLPRLFQSMFHSARGQKTGVVGAGLGLSICKGLVEAHGGKIWIESKEGVGTSCYFTLPIKIPRKSTTR